MHLPQSLLNTVNSFASLPGIGTRSAERLTFSLLKNKSGLAAELGNHLATLTDKISECTVCCNYADTEIDPTKATLCSICQQTSRKNNVLCIVESPMDVLALEKTHEYKGAYHVLHGIISPLKKIDADKIRIKELFKRDLTSFTEIIFALPGTTEAEATSLYLIDRLEQFFAQQATKPPLTRLARGIPSGSDLDYLDIGTLSRAIVDRRQF